MKKERYTRLQLDITEFDSEDVIATSADIEVMPEHNGGGVLDDPSKTLPIFSWF